MSTSMTGGFVGQFVKLKRQQGKMKQRTLAERSGVDQGNISKIESGGIANPTDETLRKLARGLALDDEDFFVKQRRIIPTRPMRATEMSAVARQTLDVGFAFCIWSAPIIAMSQAVPIGIRLAGLEATAAESPRPEWLENTTCPKWWEPLSHTSSGDAPLNIWAGDRFYTAADLIPMLRNGQFDCVAVARDAYIPDDPSIVRCCEILHSIGGPEIVLFISEEVRSRKELDDQSTLSDAWEAFAAEQEAPIFFGTNTNAETVVAQLRAALHMKPELDQSRISTRFCDVPLSDFGDLFDKELDGLINEAKTFAFVGWQPQISWLCEAAERERRNYLIKRGLPTGIVPSQRGQYISFDLLFARRRFREWLTSDRLEAFLDGVDYYAKQISSTNVPPASILRKVSQYLQMSPDECERELGKLEFSVSYDPIWHKELLHMHKDREGI